MGKLVSTSIANLINGVSQQPDSIRLPTQAKEVINCYPSVVEFLKRRASMKHVAKILSEDVSKAGVHIIDRDESEKYIVVVTNSTIKVFTIDGVPKTVNFPSGSSYLTVESPNTDISFLTINDYTFILNRKKVTKLLPDKTPKRSPEGLVFIKQASYSTTYRVYINGQKFEHTTPTQTTEVVQSTAIASALKTAIDAALSSTFTVTLAQSTLWIRKNDGTDFELKVEDTRSNTHMSVVKGKVQKFTDLPTVAPVGFVVEIAGDASSSFDNYFVKFEPTNASASFDTGIWMETIKPDIPYKLDPSTMPHALVREADGSFTFKHLTWDERTCGDEKSAPEPSFVNRPLSNIFFYRNRLSLLSGENVVMSATSEYFRFFVSTVTTMVDSDPIDVAASHTKVSSLEHAVAFSGGLLLFSQQTQFSLEHDDVLSNTTVSVKPVTEFAASMKAAPVSSGRTIFFCTNKGRFGGVREYFNMTESESNDAADITAHVPQYIAGDIYKMVCSSNEDILFVLSEQAPNQVWVYKFFWNGNEKLQSSWTRWEFVGNVRGLALQNTTAYFAIQYPDGLYLERMDFEPGYKDEYAQFEYRMDRKVVEAKVSVGYDPATQVSTIFLPYKLYPGMTPLVVTRHHPEATDAPGVELDVIVEDRTGGVPSIKVRGYDLRQAKFYVGVAYRSKYEFSKQVVRESSGQNGQTSLLDGRLQLRQLHINYNDTGYLEAHVTPQYRATSIYTFTGKVIGHGSNILGATNLYSGTFTVPVLSKNDQVDISIESSSFLPFNLVSADWEGFFNMRSSRI